MSKTLVAFSNLSRLKIIICLGEKNKNVTELISHCELSQSAVSQHLMKLKEAGIVKCIKKGREQIYKVNNKKLILIAKEIYKLIQKENEQSKRN